MLSGAGTITFDGESRLVEPGDAVLVPTDVDHGVDVVGDEPLRFLLIFGKAAPAGA